MANDLRNIIRVETQGIEEFLAFTKKAKSELLAIKKIMQDKGFKGSDSDAMKMAAAYRREMLKAIQDVGKANSKMLLSVMNAQKNAAQSKGGAKSDANVKELEIAIAVVKELTKTANESKEALQGLQNEIKDLNSTQEKSNKTKKETVQLSHEELVQLEAEKLKKREAMQVAKQNAIIQNAEKDTIAAVKAQLALVTIQWNKLTEAETLNTRHGKEVTAEKLRLKQQLDRLREATDDHTGSVGKYTKVWDKTRNVLFRIFVGRQIFDGLRNLAGFFGDLVEKGKAYNGTLSNLSASFSEVGKGFAFIGTRILEFFAPAILFVTDLLRTIPAIFGGIIAAATQFGANVSARFEILGLNIQRVFQQINKSNPFSKQSTEQINASIAEIDRQINQTAASTVDVWDAFNKGYADTIAAQEQFAAAQKEQEGREERLKKLAESKAKAEEDKVKEMERQKALAAELISISENRLKAEETLINELAALQIEAIEDVTQKAIAAEIERNRLQQDATADNFIELRKQRLEELEKIKEYLSKKSEEYIKFEKETYDEIILLGKLNDKVKEQQEKAHQAELKKIKSDAAAANRIAAFTAAKEAVSDQKKYNDEKKAALKQAEDELLEETKAYNAAKKEEEEKAAEDAKKLQDAIVSGVDVAFNSIQKIMAAASAAENKMFEDAIAARQKTIDDLGKRLENATGVERQFLERRIAQEKAALDKQNKQAEQARKDAAESARAVALIQAIVNTALAVTSALATPPYPVGAALAITAGIAGAAEITAIALQKFAMGGEIKGKSHAEGGVPIKVKGGPMIEAEGGEFIVNKYSTKKYRKEIEYYNNLGLPGGGRKFQFGGEVSPNFQAIAKASNGEQRRTAKEIANTQIVVSVTDITNMQKRVANVAQKSSF